MVRFGGLLVIALLLAFLGCSGSNDSEVDTVPIPDAVFEGQKYVLYDVRFLHSPTDEDDCHVVARLAGLTTSGSEGLGTAALMFDQDVEQPPTDLTYIDGTFNMSFGGGGSSTTWKVRASDGAITGTAIDFSGNTRHQMNAGRGAVDIHAPGIGEGQYGFVIHEEYVPVSNVVLFTKDDFQPGDVSATYETLLGTSSGS